MAVSLVAITRGPRVPACGGGPPRDPHRPDERRAREAGLSCDVQAPAGLAANVDPDRIREAVDNLVDNALRFASAGTPIVLAARAAGGDLTVEVTDHGPGFPAEFLPHAFERFRRPDSGRARSDGRAGLGLAIVSAIAHAHGGRAAVGNLPGGGALVALELPCAVDRGSRAQGSGRRLNSAPASARPARLAR